MRNTYEVKSMLDKSIAPFQVTIDSETGLVADMKNEPEWCVPFRGLLFRHISEAITKKYGAVNLTLLSSEEYNGQRCN